MEMRDWVTAGGLYVALGDILRCSGPCRAFQLPLHQWLHYLLVLQAAVPLPILNSSGAAGKVSTVMSWIVHVSSCLPVVGFFFFFFLL